MVIFLWILFVAVLWFLCGYIASAILSASMMEVHLTSEFTKGDRLYAIKFMFYGPPGLLFGAFLVREGLFDRRPIWNWLVLP